MAPEHDLVNSITTPECRAAVEAYQTHVTTMSPLERMTDKEKTGVFTGSYAINPINNDAVPIYLSSFVIADYGTGIVMGVPAHCERDFEFAQQFDLPLKQVISSPDIKRDYDGIIIAAYTGDGTLVESGLFDGMQAQSTGKNAIIDFLVAAGFATKKTNYKLRDWVFSRQRYWGEPIPLIHCQKCGVVPVPEDQLPVLLPEVEYYQPTDTGESPLAAMHDWVNVTCPQCNGPAKRETNTMPQWAGSCWYFLRYPNPHLKTKAFDQKDMRYWLPVDLYVGGIEHAILHLLYARFYVKVLHDLGYLSFDEPFKHLFNQGMVLKYSEKSGLVEKMSKSKGNVVSPDQMVDKYGSDVLRMYMLFMGPPELDCEWQDTGLEGIKRFLQRFWTFMTDMHNHTQEYNEQTARRIHTFMKDFQERLDRFKPNTAIASFMELLNDLTAKQMRLTPVQIEVLATLLSCMAPHMASELLRIVVGKQLHECAWPTYDPALVTVTTARIIVQVNGKVRAQLDVPCGMHQHEVEKTAKPLVSKWLEHTTLIKIIFISDKLINFVVQ